MNQLYSPKFGASSSAPPKNKTDEVLKSLSNKHAEDQHDPNGEIWLISYADMMTLLFGLFVILFSMSSLDKVKYESFRKEAAENFGGNYQIPTEHLKKEVDLSLKESGLLGSGVQTTQTVEGLELSFKGQSFFESGSAELSPEAKKFIQLTSYSIKRTGDDYVVRVEGHTDDAPVSTQQFPSNWELSSSRATAVVRLLEQYGIQSGRLEAIGYGFSRPLKPNRSPSGEALPENMAQNRRIVIKIRKIDPREKAAIVLPATR